MHNWPPRLSQLWKQLQLQLQIDSFQRSHLIRLRPTGSWLRPQFGKLIWSIGQRWILLAAESNDNTQKVSSYGRQMNDYFVMLMMD